MNPYMAYAGDSPEDGAFLVFAHSVKEAKKEVYSTVCLMMNVDYIEVSVRRLRNNDWLFKEADQKMLERKIPHVIDNPKVCCLCELWGVSKIGTDGLCDECRQGDME